MNNSDVYAQQHEMSTLTFNLLVTLLIIGSISLFAFCMLVIIRRVRNNRIKSASALPLYSEQDISNPAAMAFAGSPHTNQRRSLFATRGKTASALQPLVRRDTGPIPEIHIHSADETDESGNQSPGTVVVVQVGQKNAGEHFEDELPPYERVGSIQARKGRSEAP